MGITPGKSHMEKQVMKLAVRCIHVLHLLTFSVSHFPNIWGLFLYFYIKKGRECVIYFSGLLAEVGEVGEPCRKAASSFPCVPRNSSWGVQSAWELFPQESEILNQANTAAVSPCRKISHGQHVQGHILQIFEVFLFITPCFTIFLLKRKPFSL